MSGYAFRSAGVWSSVFNTTMTPTAPSGFLVGDTLVVAAWANPGSYAIPDLSSYGFAVRTLNSAVMFGAMWTKVAAGGDTMPTFQYGNDFQVCCCIAYSGGPNSISAAQAAVDRANSTLTSGVAMPGVSTPSQNGVLCIALSVRALGSATGVTFSSTWGGNFTTRTSYVTDNRPHAAVSDWIQGTAAGQSLSTHGTSPADSAGQSNGGGIIFLAPPPPAEVPPAGSLGATGNVPSVVGATNSVLAPLTARVRGWRERLRWERSGGGVLVPTYG